MANSQHVQVADAIAAELNDPDRSWANEFVAERSWHPVYRPADLEQLRVAVVPLTIGQEQFDRARDRFTFTVVIDFQRKVDPEDRESLDALDVLAEQVHDYFRSAHRLTGLPAWEVTEARRPDVYSLEMLHAERAWETLIEVEIRGVRT